MREVTQEIKNKRSLHLINKMASFAFINVQSSASKFYPWPPDKVFDDF